MQRHICADNGFLVLFWEETCRRVPSKTRPNGPAGNICNGTTSYVGCSGLDKGSIWTVEIKEQYNILKLKGMYCLWTLKSLNFFGKQPKSYKHFFRLIVLAISGKNNHRSAMKTLFLKFGIGAICTRLNTPLIKATKTKRITTGFFKRNKSYVKPCLMAQLEIFSLSLQK